MKQAGGLEPGAYYDDGLFAVERERIFGGNWVPVCRLVDVARPGDYVTYSLAGDPVVVSHTQAGELVAMANVCRHRNMLLVEGSGNVAAMRCPYHHWTYRLNGTLAAAPNTADVEGFDRDAFCLPRLAVEEWKGFVLVNTDPAAPPLGPQLAALDEMLDGTPVADLVRVGSIDWDQPWNWKLTVENYSESYHHQGVHPDTLQPIFPGELSRPVTGGDEPWMCLEHGIAMDGVDPLLVVTVYPLLLPTFVGSDVMIWLKLEVHGPDRSTLTTEVFMTPEKAADEEFVEFELETLRTVNTQDERPNRGVFAGVTSRWAVPATLHPLEAGLEHFAAWYRNCIAG